MINIYDIILENKIPKLKIVGKYNCEKNNFYDELVTELCFSEKLDESFCEKIYVIAIGKDDCCLGAYQISKGDNDSSVIYPRTVYAFLFLVNAYKFIFVHNHPNGNLTLSKCDISTHQEFDISSKLIGMELIDSYVFTSDGLISFNGDDENVE